MASGKHAQQSRSNGSKSSLTSLEVRFAQSPLSGSSTSINQRDSRQSRTDFLSLVARDGETLQR